MQSVEYRINKGVLGISKRVEQTVFEVTSDTVEAHTSCSFSNLQSQLKLPVVPPTMVDICRVLNIEYNLQVRNSKLKLNIYFHQTKP